MLSLNLSAIGDGLLRKDTEAAQLVEQPDRSRYASRNAQVYYLKFNMLE